MSPHDCLRSYLPSFKLLNALLLLLSAFCLLALPASASDEVPAPADVIIEGIVRLSDQVRLKSSAVKVLVDWGEQSVFVRANGYFALRVDPGTHFLQVSAVGATFPQVRLDVSARHRGRFKATVLVDGVPVYSANEELTIAPISPEVYYEKREPFSIWSLLKSPMGIMVVVMGVGALVLPSLMEGIDPEEMKQMQEQMKTAPSITSLLSSGGAAPLPAPPGGRNR